MPVAAYGRERGESALRISDPGERGEQGMRLAHGESGPCRDGRPRDARKHRKADGSHGDEVGPDDAFADSLRDRGAEGESRDEPGEITDRRYPERLAARDDARRDRSRSPRGRIR